jgi:hypothetical protein
MPGFFAACSAWALVMGLAAYANGALPEHIALPRDTWNTNLVVAYWLGLNSLACAVAALAAAWVAPGAGGTGA